VIPDWIFSKKILKKDADQSLKEDDLADKILKAYARMKLRADRCNQRRKQVGRNGSLTYRS
jgi:hypothetical protein